VAETCAADSLIHGAAGSVLEWRNCRIPRMVLGTAQMGMPYGIANTNTGSPSASAAREVVAAAWECGVRFFDTAQAYGESERFLGTAIGSLAVEGAHLISKLHPALDPADARAILRSVEESVERLGRPLWAMLLHQPVWLAAWDRGLGEALGEAQRQGLVKHLGASVYTVEEARSVLAHPAMEMVQAPASAWDQRMLRDGIFNLAAAEDKLCFVRSIYLQGLLLLPAGRVAKRLAFARGASEQWERLARRYGMAAGELAVRCALSLPVPAVVGMETADQVRENARLFALEPLSKSELDEIHTTMAAVLDERTLNPSSWGAPE